MADVLLTRTLSGYAPADDPSREVWKGIKVQETVRATIRRPRNLKHHRKFWALCELVAQNSEGRTAEDVATLLKLATGHRDELPMRPTPCPHCGSEVERVALIPRSISFAKLDQIEFEAFFERCLDVVAERIVPGVQKADLRRELQQIVGYGEAA